MKDIYSMTEEDFRAEGFKHGEQFKGNVSAAIDKVASEVDVMAYFSVGVMKRMAYTEGFKAGFGLDG